MAAAPRTRNMAAKATAAIITLTGTQASARSIGPMKYARAFAMAPVLPNGQVFVVGGQPFPVPFTDTDAVLVPGARTLQRSISESSYESCNFARQPSTWARAQQTAQGCAIPCLLRARARPVSLSVSCSTLDTLPLLVGLIFSPGSASHSQTERSDNMAWSAAELWDPKTEKFTPVAIGASPRTYHSVALLLQDGRVFSGGAGLCGGCDTNHFNGQIWSPPYLFNADDTPATRPTITVDKTIVGALASSAAW